MLRSPEGCAPVTLAPAATGLWREVGSWRYLADQGEAGREKAVEVSVGVGEVVRVGSWSLKPQFPKDGESLLTLTA